MALTDKNVVSCHTEQVGSPCVAVEVAQHNPHNRMLILNEIWFLHYETVSGSVEKGDAPARPRQGGFLLATHLYDRAVEAMSAGSGPGVIALLDTLIFDTPGGTDQRTRLQAKFPRLLTLSVCCLMISFGYHYCEGVTTVAKLMAMRSTCTQPDLVKLQLSVLVLLDYKLYEQPSALKQCVAHLPGRQRFTDVKERKFNYDAASENENVPERAMAECVLSSFAFTSACTKLDISKNFGILVAFTACAMTTPFEVTGAKLIEWKLTPTEWLPFFQALDDCLCFLSRKRKSLSGFLSKEQGPMSWFSLLGELNMLYDWIEIQPKVGKDFILPSTGDALDLEGSASGSGHADLDSNSQL
ncbi:hypothetical protein HKX48_008277 [Thoreauomyces humboldtii]|nr:hypothetical protein HKX48_008277 [Thoreauomyces humboldtii]